MKFWRGIWAAKNLEAWRVSTGMRLAVGLACIVGALVLTADLLKLVPRSEEMLWRSRLRVGEALALQCAVALERGDLSAMEAALELFVQRDPEILSAAVRNDQGQILLQAGEHQQVWKLAWDQPSTPDQLRIPLQYRGRIWGQVEVCFRPRFQPGLGILGAHPLVKLAVFITGAAFLLFVLYLRRTLRHLDPSAVIPERIRQLLDTLAEGILVLDVREQIVLANQALTQIIGQPAEQLCGRKVEELGWMVPEDQEEGDWPWSRSLATGKAQLGEFLKLRDAKGCLRTLTVNTAPILGPDGRIRGALATFDDMTLMEQKNAQLRDLLHRLEVSYTQVEEQNRKLEFLAHHDGLTACLNRRALFDRGEILWQQAAAEKKNLVCLMMDVDHFKKVNDEHGHAIGDEVLARVGEVARQEVADRGLVGRYGGEEFCVLATGMEPEEAVALAERIRQSVQALKIGPVQPTISLGVAWTDGSHEDSLARLIDRADQALYIAKRTGRNRVVRFADIAALSSGSTDASSGSPSTRSSHIASPDTSLSAQKGQAA